MDDALSYALVLGISFFKFIELLAWIIVKDPRSKDTLAGVSQVSRHLGPWSCIEILLSIPWTTFGLVLLHENSLDRTLGFIFTIGGFCWIATACLTIRWLQKSASPSPL